MKINSLTATRAIAALMVVIHHFGSELVPFCWFGKLFRSGNLSVSYFFVLSGFVLFMSQSKIHYAIFLKNRITRIVPAYLIALIASVGYLLVYYPNEEHLVKQIIVSFFFVQTFFYTCVLKINPLAWSVSIEMFFYLLFPLLLLFSKNKKAFIWCTITIFVLSQIIHIYYAPKIWDLSGSGIYYSPIIHLNQFMVGMVGAMIYKQNSQRFNKNWISLIILFFIIALIVCRPDNLSYQTGLIAPFFMLLILSIASTKKSWLASGLLVYLGEISYGLYIYQYPVFKILQKQNLNYFHLSPYLFFYLSLSLLVLVAALSYKLVEKPLISYFKKR